MGSEAFVSVSISAFGFSMRNMDERAKTRVYACSSFAVPLLCTQLSYQSLSSMVSRDQVSSVA